MSNVENQESSSGDSKSIYKDKLSFAEKVKRIIISNNLRPIIIGYSAVYPELDVLFYHQNYKSNNVLSSENFIPENANMIIIHGNLNRKFDPYLKECYEKLHFPKVVIVLGGNSKVQNYCQSKLLGSEVPIDYFLPGFPPNPIEILDLLKKIKSDVRAGLK